MAPDLPLPRTLRIFRSAAAFNERHPQDAIPLTGLYQRRLRALIENASRRSAGLGRPLRILDLSCGDGLLTCALASQGHRALGVDLSPSDIRRARLLAQEEKLDGMFIQCDWLHDPGWERITEDTLGGKPDLVHLTYVLQHVVDVPAFFTRLKNWLEPPSHLVINEENPGAPSFRFAHGLRHWFGNAAASQRRSLDEWARLLAAHGFQVSPHPIGIDPFPGISRVRPERCWSIVFTAQRS